MLVNFLKVFFSNIVDKMLRVFVEDISYVRRTYLQFLCMEIKPRSQKVSSFSFPSAYYSLPLNKRLFDFLHKWSYPLHSATAGRNMQIFKFFFCSFA